MRPKIQKGLLECQHSSLAKQFKKTIRNRALVHKQMNLKRTQKKVDIQIMSEKKNLVVITMEV
jgi:hypothetical protein